MKLNDREMLEDLIRAAVNQAIKKATAGSGRGDRQDGCRAWACPPGLNLPEPNQT